MKPAFSFQVISKGVIININPEVDFEKLKSDLLKHVKEATDFFSGVDLYINLNGREMELSRLKIVMKIVQKYNKIKNIYFTSEEKAQKEKKFLKKETVLIRRTLRSGQRIKYPTNIVILGDVNPGAEVIAGGDVIVLGSLRGVVHAGADGSIDNAQVVALKLDPTQLRINNIISRPPEHENKNNIKPERAFIKDSNIIVEEIIEF